MKEICFLSYSYKRQWNIGWACVRKHDIFTCQNNKYVIFACRLRVVPLFFLRDSRASETRAGVKISQRAPFLKWGDFYARSRFARSTIPEEKWGTTRSLLSNVNRCETFTCSFMMVVSLRISPTLFPLSLAVFPRAGLLTDNYKE